MGWLEDLGVLGRLWACSALQFSREKRKAGRCTAEAVAPIWALADLSLQPCRALSSLYSLP